MYRCMTRLEKLPIASFSWCPFVFGPGSFSFISRISPLIAQLQIHRKSHRKFDEMIALEWLSRFQTVRHDQLAFYGQQAVQEYLEP